MKYVLIIICTIVQLTSYGQEWQITPISNDGFKPILSIDDLDRVHIVYMSEAINGWVKYARLENGSLSGSTVSNGYFYGPPDITYDRDNNPVIAFHNHDTEDQAVYIWDGTNWQDRSTPDDGHDGWDNSIIVDGEGLIHTSSVNPFGGAGIEYGLFQNGEWRVDSVGSGTIMYANATSIGMDSDKNIYISYFNDRDGRLEMASLKGNGWTTENVDDGPNVGRFSSLVVTDNDDILISYYADAGLIKLAVHLGGQWMLEEVDILENVEIGFFGARNITSLVQNGSQFGLAYGDKSVIKLATFSLNLLDITIDTVVVATDQDFGQIVSLDFNSAGVPFIAYSGSDETNNPLGNVFVISKSGQSTATKDAFFPAPQLYPNPVIAGQKMSIDGGVPGPFHMQLFDASGRLVQQDQNLFSGINLMDQIQAGVYFLLLRNIDATWHKKIIITK